MFNFNMKLQKIMSETKLHFIVKNILRKQYRYNILLICICYTFGLKAGVLHPNWDIEKAEHITTLTREKIILNGLWRLAPFAKQKDGKLILPQKFEYFTKVPGVWCHKKYGTDIISERTGKVVSVLNGVAFSDVRQLWLYREFICPDSWKNRAVYLSCNSLSERAFVFLNGKKVGMIERSGKVNLSSTIKIGHTNKLAILIDFRKLKRRNWRSNLSKEEKTAETIQAVGAAAEFCNLGTKKSNVSPYPGIISDLWLESRPKNLYIEHYYIITSYRKHSLTIRCRVKNVGDKKFSVYLKFVAKLKDRIKKEFSSNRFNITPNSTKTITFTSKWQNPAYWCPNTPNLYAGILRLNLDKTEKILDEKVENFGFRELWIDGKNYRLNGNIIHLYGDTQYAPSYLQNEDPKTVLSFFKRMKRMGLNCYPTALNILDKNLQNIQYRRRSNWFYDIADKEGIIITLSLPCYHRSMAKLYLTNKQFRNAINRKIKDYLEHYGNHASVCKLRANCVMTGYPNWTNPQCLAGYQASYCYPYAKLQRAAAIKLRQCIRNLDPCKRIINNGGGNYDGITTAYHYPNFGIPLQELKDWPEKWSAQSNQPLVLEEGDFTGSCPLYWRNWRMFKWGKGKTHRSKERYSAKEIEPILPETAARFLGDKAYTLLRDSYMDLPNPQKNQARDKSESLKGGLTLFLKSPAALAVMELYAKEVTQAWRAYGITEIWHHGVSNQNLDNVVWAWNWYPTKLNRFHNLNRHGMIFDRITGALETKVYDTLPEDIRKTKVQNVFCRAMRPLLIFIGGYKKFTSVEHAYFSGESVKKQVVIVNGTMHDHHLKLITSLIDKQNEVVDEIQLTRNVQQGEILMIPFYFIAPKVMKKKYYKIKVICNGKLEDTFNIQVFPKEKISFSNNISDIALYDPEKTTERWLTKAGIPYTLLENLLSLQKVKLLIVGRNGYTDYFRSLAKAYKIDKAVKEGMNLVILEQKAFPQSDFQDTEGDLKTVSHRRVFIKAPNHPILEGLNNDDFANWRGEANLIEAKPANNYNTWNYDHRRFQKWGNEGIVATCVYEKPDIGNFTILLDSGFDLSQTALLEYKSGKGRILFCQLDLTNRYGKDPVATIIAQRIIREGLKKYMSVENKLGLVSLSLKNHVLTDIPCSTNNFFTAPMETKVAAVNCAEKLSQTQIDKLLTWIENGGTLLCFLRAERKMNLAWLPFKIRVRDKKFFKVSITKRIPLLEGIGNSDFFQRKWLAVKEITQVPAFAIIPLAPAIIAEVPYRKGRFIFLPAFYKSDFKPDNTINRPYAKRARIYSTILTNLGIKIKGTPYIPEKFTYPGNYFKRTTKTCDFDPDYHVQW